MSGIQKLYARTGGFSTSGRRPLLGLVFVDPLHPGTFLEEFLMESWWEHLRQHERGTADDWNLQESIRAMQTSSDLLLVTHYLADERVASHK